MYRAPSFAYCRSDCIVFPIINELYVYECVFENSNEVVISINKNWINFLHSSCYFKNCSSPTHGGVIYFYCAYADIIQRRFCTISSISSQTGFHSYSYQPGGTAIFLEGSICNCSNTKSESTLRIVNGNISLSSCNFSRNSALYRSAFYIEDSPGASSSFCTFENNHATGFICIQINSQNNNQFCNMIKNNQDTTNYGGFYSATTSNIKNWTFRDQGRAFSGDGPITLINCNIDKNTQTTGARLKGIVYDEDYKSIPFLSTYECQAKVALNRDRFRQIVYVQNTVQMDKVARWAYVPYQLANTIITI